MRGSIAAVLALAACGGPAPGAFSERFARAACRQESRCDEEASWYLTDGMDACEATVRERYNWDYALQDPCMVYDGRAASACLRAIGSSCEDRVLSFIMPIECNEVWIWEEEGCVYGGIGGDGTEPAPPPPG